jgi:hypothetical protein
MVIDDFVVFFIVDGVPSRRRGHRRRHVVSSSTADAAVDDVELDLSSPLLSPGFIARQASNGVLSCFSASATVVLTTPIPSAPSTILKVNVCVPVIRHDIAAERDLGSPGVAGLDCGTYCAKALLERVRFFAEHRLEARTSLMRGRTTGLRDLVEHRWMPSIRWIAPVCHRDADGRAPNPPNTRPSAAAFSSFSVLFDQRYRR